LLSVQYRNYINNSAASSHLQQVKLSKAAHQIPAISMCTTTCTTGYSVPVCVVFLSQQTQIHNTKLSRRINSVSRSNRRFENPICPGRLVQTSTEVVIEKSVSSLFNHLTRPLACEHVSYGLSDHIHINCNNRYAYCCCCRTQAVVSLPQNTGGSVSVCCITQAVMPLPVAEHRR